MNESKSLLSIARWYRYRYCFRWSMFVSSLSLHNTNDLRCLSFIIAKFSSSHFAVFSSPHAFRITLPSINTEAFLHVIKKITNLMQTYNIYLNYQLYMHYFPEWCHNYRHNISLFLSKFLSMHLCLHNHFLPPNIFWQ